MSMKDFIIGDIGNTITKICLVERKNYKIKSIHNRKKIQLHIKEGKNKNARHEKVYRKA